VSAYGWRLEGGAEGASLFALVKYPLTCVSVKESVLWEVGLVKKNGREG